jgi:hypothetical protein
MAKNCFFFSFVAYEIKVTWLCMFDHYSGTFFFCSRLYGGFGSTLHPNFDRMRAGTVIKQNNLFMFLSISWILMALCYFQILSLAATGHWCYFASYCPEQSIVMTYCLYLEFPHWWTWMLPFNPWTSSQTLIRNGKSGSITGHIICKKFLPIPPIVLLTPLSLCSCVCGFGTHDKHIFWK